MLTHSGKRVFPEEEGAPGIEDIATSLGRQPRFGGHTMRWWPVLLHSLVVHDLALRTGLTSRTALLGLIHDGHEAVTGDIPRTWKTDEMRAIQKELDVRILAELGIEPFTDQEKDEVKLLDNIALVAEASVIGPPTIMKEVEYISKTVDETAANLVRDYLRKYPNSTYTTERSSPAVAFYLHAYYQLRG